MNAQNALSRNQIENAKKYLSVYEKVDPQNPDVYFLMAEYYMLQKKPDQALSMLKRSAELGYSNYENLTQNSHFISLHTNPSFKKIADKVRQNIDTE
jgi:tetratricopeptide (TPR) repeat protein